MASAHSNRAGKSCQLASKNDGESEATAIESHRAAQLLASGPMRSTRKIGSPRQQRKADYRHLQGGEYNHDSDDVKQNPEFLTNANLITASERHASSEKCRLCNNWSQLSRAQQIES
jgi:hypothetical protein